MKIENGKIVSATEEELFRLYLDRGMDDAMSFAEYRFRMGLAGCHISKSGSHVGGETVGSVGANPCTD